MSTPSPTASNVILFEMLMHYKTESERLTNVVNEQSNSLINMHAVVATKNAHINALTGAVTNMSLANEGLREGGQIVVRALDQLFATYTRMKQDYQLGNEYREEVHRIMMRGDVGFSIIQGAPFIDLTTNEIVDPEETESESEEEMEI